MKRILRENSLSITMFALFFLFLIGQTLTGFHVYNEDNHDHHQPAVTLGSYLKSGHFVEAVFENWESEFLQMGAYVLLTVFLFQKGSSESKPLEGDEEIDEDPEKKRNLQKSPYAVRKGGLALKFYKHSLSLSLFALFGISFVLHAVGGAAAHSEEELQHGGQRVGVIQFIQSPDFWFQSFQNWQSEFLSIGALLVLSIIFREQGSPESKPVAAPNDQTGD